MKLRNTAIALGIGAATATGLSLLKVNKDLVVGSTAVVIGAGLMVALRDKNDLNTKARDYEYFFNRAQDKFELADYEESTQCAAMQNVIWVILKVQFPIKIRH